MLKYTPIFIGTLLCLICSCTKRSFSTTEELWEYLTNEDHGYHHSKTVQGVTFAVTYKPIDLLVTQELGEARDPKTIDSLRIKYGNYLYFNLSMSKNDQELLTHKAKDRQQFGAMVNQLAFGMEEKIHLYTPEKDTIPMADYHYPRMYGMSRATSMLLVYPRDERIVTQEYIKITIEDLGLYTGDVTFKIPTEIISNEPQLTF